MSVSNPRAELGAFLRHRRGLVAPQAIGLPATTGRRVPGLRREELAIMSGVSPDHYQRIEQGRVNPSVQVLEAIATTLGLDDTERAHLHALAAAHRGPSAPRHGRRRHDQRTADLSALVAHFNGPAFALNHCRDVLAWNTLGAELITDFGVLPAQDRNMVWLMLTDPALQDLYPDWETGARAQVAMLRRASALNPGDSRIQQLVGRLSTHSDRFVQWWALREVREKTAGTKTLNHPSLGQLSLAFQVLHPSAAPDVELFTYYPTDDTTAEALRALSATSTTS
ncbi:helix-turn-helix domain-containing protein [Streptomyces sp. NPDC049881]|uniref:helix-turn-helix domain-containing protein n=1 Tax=Streptomyces sp. NPDC049881 TaxID=3155778 RepID=UPI003446C1D3